VIGKASFDEKKLVENYGGALDEILQARPTSSKGRHPKKVTVSTTTDPGVPVDPRYPASSSTRSGLPNAESRRVRRWDLGDLDVGQQGSMVGTGDFYRPQRRRSTTSGQHVVDGQQRRHSSVGRVGGRKTCADLLRRILVTVLH
jgi:hypothetical protein